ncbi:MAG: AtpZ/AtpI family protein [Candidatus Brocadiales bacterium]
MPENGKDSVRLLSRTAGLGFFMAGSIVGGYLVGSYLDSYLGTSPYLLLVFLLLGIVAGFLEFYKTVKNLVSEKKK